MIEKFKRKPQEVEAIQVTFQNLNKIVEWLGDDIMGVSNSEDNVWVQFLNKDRDVMTFWFDQWIVKDEDGNFSRFSNEEFNKKFEEVE